MKKEIKKKIEWKSFVAGEDINNGDAICRKGDVFYKCRASENYPINNTMEIKINEKEKKVLQFLAQFWEDVFNCVFFKYIAEETKLTVKEARRACRSLGKKGLTKYVTGLFHDDGMIAGSGYCCTRKGAEFIEKITL